MSATAARLTLNWIGIRLSGYCNHNPSEVLSQDGAERPDRMEPANVLEGYARDAPHLVRSFEEISSTDVYAHLAHLLPAQPATSARVRGAMRPGSPRKDTRCLPSSQRTICAPPVWSFILHRE
ncbi:hypothetical protein [Shinella sp. BYT-45]|uniref:hypothetical protein n=1 Tax=Shinella sp. BYT-45 TaxID=3377377 RepID=UPI003980E920